MENAQVWYFGTSCCHCFRLYATLEDKTPAETFPKFPSVLRVIADRIEIHQSQPDNMRCFPKSRINESGGNVSEKERVNE